MSREDEAQEEQDQESKARDHPLSAASGVNQKVDEHQAKEDAATDESGKPGQDQTHSFIEPSQVSGNPYSPVTKEAVEARDDGLTNTGLEFGTRVTLQPGSDQGLDYFGIDDKKVNDDGDDDETSKAITPFNALLPDSEKTI